MGAPVSVIVMPRTRPSVEDMAMARTTPSPRCCWTSSVSFSGLAGGGEFDGERLVDGGHVLRRELDVDDGADDLDDFADVHDEEGLKAEG